MCFVLLKKKNSWFSSKLHKKTQEGPSGSVRQQVKVTEKLKANSKDHFLHLHLPTKTK